MTGATGTARITVVSVVFAADIPFLMLQARSLAQHLDPECVAEILVLDNCASGLPPHTIRALNRELGIALSARLSIVRTRDLGVDATAHGWRSQQAAKLLVAHRIRTPHYVVLDAKNHLVAPAGIDTFIDADGHALGGTHPYTTHPLRHDLERTLRYLGADDEALAHARDDFPPTATPFVMATETVRALIADVERRSGRGFVEEFERADLLEFFLYSGWSMLRGPGRPVNGTPIQAPVLWQGAATAQGAEAVIIEAERTNAAWFAVHRRALMRGDAAMRDRVVAFWADRQLMTIPEGRRFVRAFRRGYYPSVAMTRITERLRAARHRPRTTPEHDAKLS